LRSKKSCTKKGCLQNAKEDCVSLIWSHQDWGEGRLCISANNGSEENGNLVGALIMRFGLGLARLYNRLGLCVSKATDALSGGGLSAASIACLTSSLSVTAELSLRSSLSVIRFARLGSSVSLVLAARPAQVVHSSQLSADEDFRSNGIFSSDSVSWHES
jgi:hypothetical protein